MKINQKISLREWQKTAFEKWQSNEFNGIISVVTGGGKTIFGIYCISYLFDRNLIDSVIVIVPTKTLQDQWASNFISITDIKMEEIGFSNKRLKKVNIITNLSAQKLDFAKLYGRYSLVYDECHRYGTLANKKILDIPVVSKLGLTATLERKYDDGVNSFLKPYIGEVIYDYDLKKALKDGVVEPYKMVNIKTHFNGQEDQEYETLTKKISKLIAVSHSKNSDSNDSDKSLELLLFKRSKVVNDSEQRAYVATKLILNNLNRKKIIFCESIAQAEEIKRLCLQEHLETLIYHSKLKQSERISNLLNFQNNYFHTLIGCKALDEGFDVPDIDFGIIVSQTTTSRQRIQRLGRTIRKADNKIKPIIYTLYTTESERTTLYEEMVSNPEIEVEWAEVK
jgi:superfamily II DNA or RNA helicase